MVGSYAAHFQSDLLQLFEAVSCNVFRLTLPGVEYGRMNRSASRANRGGAGRHMCGWLLRLGVPVVIACTGTCGGSIDPRQDAAADATFEAAAETGDDRPSTADARDAANRAEGGTCPPPVTQDGTCNSIPLRGVTIRSTCSPAPIPQPGGGSIDDGTYVLDTMTFYGTCPANAAQQRTTWVICGGSWQMIEELERISGNPDAGLLTERVGVSMMLQPTSVTGDVVCWFAPGTGPSRVTWSYDATPGHLSLYIPIAPGVRVDSFTRQ
jgi:hypothetical protein